MRLLSLAFLIMWIDTLDCQIHLDYQLPNKDILDLADVNPAPRIMMNTEATTGVLLYRSMFKSIQELSEDEMRLGGLRINPKTNISSRTTYYTDLRIMDIQGSKEYLVTGMPEKPRISNVNWSNDQNKLSFTHTASDHIQLWIVNLETRNAYQLSDRPLNANMGAVATWLKDDKALLVKTLPDNRKALIDKSNYVPSGPTVSVNEGQKAQNRTYQDLLSNPTDEHNFEVLAHSEIYKFNLDGSSVKWLNSAMYDEVSISPDGNYILLTEIQQPFSYIVPYYRFPQLSSVLDKNGKVVKIVLEAPLIEEMPKGFMAVQKGPRSMSWRADLPSSLTWAEALDGGDPNIEITERDAVYQWDAPFTSAKKHLLNTKLRYAGIVWGDDKLAVLYENWWNTRTLRTLSFNPSQPSQEKTLINERNYQDRYSDPGTFVTAKNQLGKYVLEQVNGQLHLIGDGFSEKGIYPFVDSYDIKSGTTKRLFQASDETKLEEISSAIDISKGIVLTSLQSKNEYPNYYFRNLKSGVLKQITSFPNPYKIISEVHKEVITYTREDGIELSGTLYLPVGYDRTKKQKLPMLLWAYPREFKDASTASQITSSPNEFTYPSYGSPIFWVNRGYAVLDDAAFPIIGEGDEEPNDSYIKQLVDNGKAAIDAVDQLGYIDRNRVGVGGHSYGAFMVANLLSHCDLFAGGIARSGAYNRTLTPFGFQSEERSYWEAPEVYYNMSPFMHADKMKTPLLMVHGEADNNSGTYPMQSERYFNALKGLGATVRLVMLPKESHGYAARESIMHLLWEQDQWLEKYVKNKDQEIKP